MKCSVYDNIKPRQCPSVAFYDLSRFVQSFPADERFEVLARAEYWCNGALILLERRGEHGGSSHAAWLAFRNAIWALQDWVFVEVTSV